jgi:hypothetical protein
MLMWHFILKRDSIAYLIRAGNDEETLAQLREIYHEEDDDFLVETLSDLKSAYTKKT